MEYEGLSEIEQEVLAEYAKLAANVTTLAHKTRALAHLPSLRALENKMGLVLTLFKASVWGVVNDTATLP